MYRVMKLGYYSFFQMIKLCFYQCVHDKYKDVNFSVTIHQSSFHLGRSMLLAHGPSIGLCLLNRY